MDAPLQSIVYGGSGVRGEPAQSAVVEGHRKEAGQLLWRPRTVVLVALEMPQSDDSATQIIVIYSWLSAVTTRLTTSGWQLNRKKTLHINQTVPLKDQNIKNLAFLRLRLKSDGSIQTGFCRLKTQMLFCH